MKALRSWLADFVDVSALSGEELQDHMMRIGVETAAVEDLGDDVCLELEVTANRPDLLSHYGIARELAAMFELPLKEPDWNGAEAVGDSGFPIEIESDACGRYCGLVLEDVEVKDSPQWLKDRLERVGLRPISNVVDATNYVLLEFNHPVHAFDLDKLDEKIVVRNAVMDETIELLDEQEYRLSGEELIIADAKHPLALAGIMGGSPSGVTRSTKRVLLEAAWFDPAHIRRTARRYGITTDSSYRFERGADYEMPPKIIRRLGTLICEIANAKITSAVSDTRAGEAKVPQPITFRDERVLRILGTDAELYREFFERIGCRVEKEKVTPPSWRGDLTREIDLIEEVARYIGYSGIPAVLPATANVTPDFSAGLKHPLGPDATAFRRFRAASESTIRELGFDRCCTLSFDRSEYGEVRIAQPLNALEDHLRATLLPALCRVAQNRIDRAGSKRIRIFEVEKTFAKSDRGPVEKWSIAGVAAGLWEEARYDGGSADEVSLDHILGVFQALKNRIAIPLYLNEESPAGRGIFSADAGIYYSETFCGRIGRIDIDGVLGGRSATSSTIGNFYGFEIDLTTLFSISGEERAVPRFIPLPRHQSSSRDLAFLIESDRKTGEVIIAASEAGGKFLENVDLFDLFAPSDGARKSVGLRLKFRSPDRAMREDEIIAALDDIIESVKKKCGAELRGVS